MSKNARKVVIPAAGLGTRMLPQTWATAKELLPIVDRPIIHYVALEAAAAGFDEVVLVIGPGKEAVADYFRRPEALARALEEKGQAERIAPLLDLQQRLTLRTAWQDEPRGLGHAVCCARQVVGDEPFAVSLPDEIFDGTPGPLDQMRAALLEAEEGTGAAALLEVPRGQTGRYGIVAGNWRDGRFYIERAVEKPEPERAPSNFALVGRYLLPPDTFDMIANSSPGAGGEIQLTDALAVLARERRLIGVRVKAKRFDTGTPRGWLAANAHFGRAV